MSKSNGLYYEHVMNDGVIKDNSITFKLPRDFIEYPAKKAIEIRKINIQLPEFLMLSVPFFEEDGTEITPTFCHIMPELTPKEITDTFLSHTDEKYKKYFEIFYSTQDTCMKFVRKPLGYGDVKFQHGMFSTLFDNFFGDNSHQAIDLLSEINNLKEKERYKITETSYGELLESNIDAFIEKFEDYQSSLIQWIHMEYILDYDEYDQFHEDDEEIPEGTKRHVRDLKTLTIRIVNYDFIFERLYNDYYFSEYRIRNLPLALGVIATSNIAHDNKQFICNVNEALIPPKYYDISGYKDTITFEFFKRNSIIRDKKIDNLIKSDPYIIPNTARIQVEIIIMAGTNVQEK
ncbi:hypothetical protein TVAG_095820 [Trichomonas vaginalis G3]|uniref:Uncharacterized protein n=1 Tax=Trichomonas vaginalis (strain ATCC PRA-98 / G3) TaxID=412133 RepID=A2G3V4_TRIV3|nr:hypothetical protein TVAG_095820 [Trichomonas vaginalis G3]|eukprot:XP_001301089.1 hypothetical protein [Trichomonas vaginalis G3]